MQKRAQRVQDVTLGPYDGTNRHTLCEDHANQMIGMANGFLDHPEDVTVSSPYDGVCKTCEKVGVEEFRHQNWARDAAGAHGHTIGEFDPHPKSKSLKVGYCTECGAPAMYNGWGHIGGRATEEDCKGWDLSSLGALSAFFRMAITVAPHLPNPLSGQRLWYHGTDQEFHNDPDLAGLHGRERMPEPGSEHNLTSPHLHPTEVPGGHLEPPERIGSEYGENSSSHWNTDLGVHFTSDHYTARKFATGNPSYGGSSVAPESRIAHCRLHIGNPKRYDSEFDLSHDAIKWAHANGYKYDPEEHIHGGEEREAFIDGDYDNEHVAEDERLHPAMNGPVSPQDRAQIADIDAEGPDDYAPKKGENWHQPNGVALDHYLRYHPDREEITAGFKKHLEDQGHDGIVYGNEYEGTHGHPCAIAFHPEQIHMQKWQWLHEDSPHYEDRNRPRNQGYMMDPDGRGGYYLNPHATAARKTPLDPMKLTDKHRDQIHQVVDDVRMGEGAGGQCGFVAEVLANKFGWECHGGYYHAPDGRVIGDHIWNVHAPSGTIIDATSDQHGEGHGIRVIPPNDPEHARYQYAEDDEDDHRRFEEAGRNTQEHGDYWWTGGPNEHARAYQEKVRNRYESWRHEGTLSRFFAAAEPVWRQPKPEWPKKSWDDVKAEMGEDGALAWADQQRQHEHHWRHEVRKAMSRGDLSPQEAWNNGYKGRGHDEHDNGAHWDDTDRHNLGWEPLPQTLYHVTTHKAGVLADGRLKSRDELSQQGGNGLGGGESDTISFTDDPEVAKHIHRALHEYHSVLTGKKPLQDLVDEAHKGGYLSSVLNNQHGKGAADHYDATGELPLPMRLVLQGRTTNWDVGGYHPYTAEQAKEKVHPDARPEDEGWIGGDGQRYHSTFSRPMTEEETLNARSSHYKAHAFMREYHDGVMDPGFIMNDPKGMAAADPSQFAIIRHHPKPGAQGYRVSALGEWRTVDGRVAPVAGVEESSPSHRLPHFGDEVPGGGHVVKQASSSAVPVRQHPPLSPLGGTPQDALLGRVIRGHELAGRSEALDLPHQVRRDQRVQRQGSLGGELHVGVGLPGVASSVDRARVGDAPLVEQGANPVQDGLVPVVDADLDVRVARVRRGHRDAAFAVHDSGEPGGIRLSVHGIHSTDGHLPNPYHSGEFGQTWFHGTIGEYDGNPDPGKSFAAMQGPSNGCGGPQMNKLLGVHFSPLHDVAQGFARPSHSTAHGRIFHARLKMSNPIHFADENDLLRHIWDTTMRGDHFHDEQHDERMQWNYGGGSTREGITRRMDAARGLPPGSLRRESPKSAMESYLQFHPRQKEIAEAYVHHLRYEGHDGITYGNTVEGPSLHHCAIAFDPKTIEVTHVDRMHPTPSPYLKDEDKAQASPRDGEVSHDHIRAIHGEPEDFLREVERYHRGGTARGDSGYSFFGPNTGKGEWTFHHANKYFPGYTDTPYTQEHAWLPHGKVFAPGKGTLDPRLFDPEGLMRASVRKVIMDRLTFVLKDRWPDWEDWSRVYLAGSEASEWWGNNDFDTLIGVNYAAARKAHSEFKPMTDDEISDAITSVFRADYNDEEWTAPWDGEVWHLTGYVNPDSWNIRKIKPYAAYDMTRSKWIVKPPHLGKEWGPEKWPEGIWEEVEAYLALIKAIGTLPEPDQSRQGALLYDTLHGDRQRAFGPNGYGWNDPGNVIWKALDLHPDHPLEKLIAWKHQAVSAEKEQAA